LEFKIYTNALKAYENEGGERFVTGTTSSTIRDLHGDEMSLNALKSMADTARQNMTVFLNHNYNVPEDLFGSATEAQIVKRFDSETGQEVYDLDVNIRVVNEDENPEALRAYRAIKRGVKLGLSIGARVEKASRKAATDSQPESIVIEKIRLMEASVVGIPANQRSYLSSAIKSLKSAGVDLDLLDEDNFDVKASSSIEAVEIEEKDGAMVEDKPEIRGDAPKSEESGVENSMDTELEKKTRVTVTVSTDGDEKQKAPAVEPVAEVDQAETMEEVKASAIPEDTEPSVDVEEDAKTEEPEKDPSIEALEALGAVLVEAEKSADSENESSVQPETAEAEVVAEAPVEEAPAAENVEADEVSSIDEVKSIAKSALDAANAAHEEVAAISVRVTELAEAKAKVEEDLSKALELIERISALGVGRRSYDRPQEVRVKSPEFAPWLSPYVQRVLEAQDEE
jgi:HK97 family phage prohead protease